MSQMEELTKTAEEFVDYYYETFDKDIEGLIDLYAEDALFTMEDEQLSGNKDIVAFLIEEKNLEGVKHRPLFVDVQPFSDESMLVLVTGELSFEKDKPMSFTQVFILSQDKEGNYFVFNDIFRLNIGE